MCVYEGDMVFDTLVGDPDLLGRCVRQRTGARLAHGEGMPDVGARAWRWVGKQAVEQCPTDGGWVEANAALCSEACSLRRNVQVPSLVWVCHARASEY
jgi:hypothetical protein